MKAKFKIINGFDIKFEDKSKFKKRQFYTDEVIIDTGEFAVKIKVADTGEFIITGGLIRANAINTGCIEIY
jgi:hypothetical protein